MSTPAALVRSIFCSLGILVAWCAWSVAVEVPGKQDIDPKAEKVIGAWGKYFSGLRGFQYASTVNLVVEQQGQKQNQNFSLSLKAARPNKLAYTVEASQQNGAQIVSDGSQLWVYIKGFQKYGVEDAPETWDEMLKNPLVMGPLNFGNAAVVTAALLNEDPAKKLLENTLSVKYGGLVELDGAKCHLIEASGEELDWQLWIDSGNKPLVRQFVPDLAKAFAQMAKRSKGKSPFENMKITNTVTFKDWETNPKLPADAFAFNVPEGVEKVDSLMDIITGGRAAEEPGPHPLVGQDAPELKLDLLDGESLELAAYKGRKIVILDFWATWCGPCVRAMPIIEKVAQNYKDKGVLLFAVNVQEEPDAIKKFLEETELKVDVALDKEGTVSQAYKAEGIPQTVIVGKDGSVQVVRVGFSANLEEELTKDLEGLLAGKNLAAQTLQAAKEKKEKKGAAAARTDDAEDGEKKAADNDGKAASKKATKAPDAKPATKKAGKK
jgi:thiol-disulfide isomerase/thioredoxin